MNALQKYRFCFLAGFCAAGGSFFGKLPTFLKDNSLYNLETPYLSTSAQAIGVFLLYQCLPIGLMIFSNLLNWRYYLKALQMTEQTLITTVLTSASNYVVTFVLGSLVFRETLTLVSAIGCIFIITGLWFLCADNQINDTKLKKL